MGLNSPYIEQINEWTIDNNLEVFEKRNGRNNGSFYEMNTNGRNLLTDFQ
ncbi:hypothetical protein [Candidatus Nitrosocosmicus sp. R]